MRYFRLFPDCRLVVGPARARIYFITKAKSFHLSQLESTILKELVGNHDVESIVDVYGESARELLDRLIGEGLGTYFEHSVAAEPYQPKSDLELRGLMEPPPVIRTLFLQLTNECDGKCSFCGDPNFHEWQGCNSCLRWPGVNGRQAASKDMQQIIEELRDLDVRRVVISGGNPLLEFDHLLALVTRLRHVKPGIEVMVHTNGGHLDGEAVERLRDLGVHLSFSVFGTSPEDYRANTGVAELFSCLQNAVALCRELRLSYSVTLVITPATNGRYRELHEFAQSLGGQGLFFMELLPKDDKRAKILSFPRGPSRLDDVDTAEFFWREGHNFCLNAKLAIALDGSILPCPSWPKPIANIGGGHGLRPVFRVFLPGIFDYWEAGKATSPGCRHCENRYACADCALLEWETHQDVSERARYCDYVPELGIWKNAGAGDA